VFTARYALSPYIKQIRHVFKGLIFIIQISKHHSWDLYGEWSTSRPGRFTPRQEPQYTLRRRLGGSQSQCGRPGDEINWSPDLPIHIHRNVGRKNVIWLHSPSQFAGRRLENKEHYKFWLQRVEDTKVTLPLAPHVSQFGAVNIVRTQSSILILSFHLHAFQCGNMPARLTTRVFPLLTAGQQFLLFCICCELKLNVGRPAGSVWLRKQHARCNCSCSSVTVVPVWLQAKLSLHV
jgi:hypothetical protein